MPRNGLGASTATHSVRLTLLRTVGNKSDKLDGDAQSLASVSVPSVVLSSDDMRLLRAENAALMEDKAGLQLSMNAMSDLVSQLRNQFVTQRAKNVQLMAHASGYKFLASKITSMPAYDPTFLYDEYGNGYEVYVPPGAKPFHRQLVPMVPAMSEDAKVKEDPEIREANMKWYARESPAICYVSCARNVTNQVVSSVFASLRDSADIRFVPDSGATDHIVNSTEYLTEIVEKESYVQGIGVERLKSVAEGALELRDDSERLLCLQRVLFVPGVQANVLFVKRLTELGISFSFGDSVLSVLADDTAFKVALNGMSRHAYGNMNRPVSSRQRWVPPDLSTGYFC